MPTLPAEVREKLVSAKYSTAGGAMVIAGAAYRFVVTGVEGRDRNFPERVYVRLANQIGYFVDCQAPQGVREAWARTESQTAA